MLSQLQFRNIISTIMYMYVFQADSVVSLEDVESESAQLLSHFTRMKKVPIEINRRRCVITHLPYRTFK